MIINFLKNLPRLLILVSQIMNDGGLRENYLLFQHQIDFRR